MQIANRFGVWPGLFNNWLDILRRVRNTCAHHGRLWNRKINYPISYNFSKAAALADLYACVSIQMSLRHTTLFSVMSLCAWLLRQVRPESRWRERVKTLLDDYSVCLMTILTFRSPRWVSLTTGGNTPSGSSCVLHVGVAIICLGRRVTSYTTRDVKEIAKLLAMLP